MGQPDMHILDYNLTVREQNFQSIINKLLREIPMDFLKWYNTFEKVISYYTGCIAAETLDHLYCLSFPERNYHLYSRPSYKVWKTIAEFIEEGSYIQFEDNDGTVWKWEFSYGGLHVLYKTVLWVDDLANQNRFEEKGGLNEN